MIFNRTVLVTLVILAGNGIANAEEMARPCQPCPCPQQPPMMSNERLTPEQYEAPQSQTAMEPSQQPSQAGSGDTLAMGLSRQGYSTSSISAAGTGIGTSAAMNAIPISTPRATISPGLLTSANVESPYALDRVFFTYSFYNNFETLNTFVDVFPPSGPATVATQRTSFDLNRYDFGIEKRLSSDVSVYVRAPVLNSSGDTGSLQIAGFDTFKQDVDGFGNLNAGIKAELFEDKCTGDVFSVGLTVAAPTSDDVTVIKSVRAVQQNPDIIEVNLAHLDPTFIQPWFGFQLNNQGAFVQGYFGVLVPDDDRVVTTFNSNLAVGQTIYENNCTTITSVTPLLNVQVLNPVHGNDKLLDFSDQVFLTPTVQLGLGNRTSTFCGVMLPVAGPRAFDIGVTTGVSYLY